MKQVLSFFFLFVGILGVQAQNPFAQYGYEPKIATLSQGKYNEFHDQDTVVQIGSVLFNTKSKQIVAFIKVDTLRSEATLEADIVSRWLSPDPHAENYLNISPYVFVANNPIIYIDPDGRDIVIWYKDENGKNASFRFTGDASNAPKNEFVQQVLGAWAHNVGNGGGDPSFNAATDENVVLNVVFTDLQSEHYSETGTVYWNPNLGTETDEGVILSPATILDHELDHGVQAQKRPSEYAKDRGPEGKRDDGYTNNEEHRVITGSEQKTARANGEISGNQVTRRNHKGNSVVTKGTTSNVKDPAKTAAYKKKQRSNVQWSIE